MPQLSIILVNYKRVQDTIECIASLHKSSFKDFSIIVVDNASCDGSVETLKRTFPDIHLIPNETNLGFAEGNNAGIRYALPENSRYILLLNNDTIVDQRMLEILISAMERNPKAGVVGPKIYYYDRSNVIWFAGGMMNIHTATAVHRGIGEVDRGQYNEAVSCDYITGCCLLARREVFETIGLLDKSYFAYFEDADFCLRARHAGFSILYEPKAILYHKISSTSSWDSPIYLYFTLRNKILFLRKNSRLSQWVPYLPALLYFYVRQFVRLIVKRRNVDGARAAWFGLSDGMRNFTGKHGEGRLAKILRNKVPR